MARKPPNTARFLYVEPLMSIVGWICVPPLISCVMKRIQVCYFGLYGFLQCTVKHAGTDLY